MVNHSVGMYYMTTIVFWKVIVICETYFNSHCAILKGIWVNEIIYFLRRFSWPYVSIGLGIDLALSRRQAIISANVDPDLSDTIYM